MRWWPTMCGRSRRRRLPPARAASGRRPRRQGLSSTTRPASNSVSSSRATSTASFRAFASTNTRKTPARTSDRCGRRAAPTWEASHSRTRRRRAGSRPCSPRRSASPRIPLTSSRITRTWASTPTRRTAWPRPSTTARSTRLRMRGPAATAPTRTAPTRHSPTPPGRRAITGWIRSSSPVALIRSRRRCR